MKFVVWVLSVWLGMSLASKASLLLSPVQIGSVVKMTNGNVRLDYDLSTGRANFYWQNSLKISGFYAGVGLDTYITDTIYSNRTWTVTNNQVEVTSTGTGLPAMKQIFILDQSNSFLTRLEVSGSALQSRWMGPVVMDTAGGVDIGSYGDDRALTMPFDNDSFSFSYNAMAIANTSMSYEAAAFYDNTTRNGLVVGSVTHDTWKTGVYFQGDGNKLDVLNVFGGITSSDTRDVSEHGLVRGNTIVSPTVFVGFGTDWRTVMEAYGDANAAVAPKLAWTGGVPFGWSSWYAYTSSVSYSNASASANFIKANLQTNHFNDHGVVYINLDAFWSNLSDQQLQQFSDNCHLNGQKAGIYWTPFVYWGTAAQGSNSFITGSGAYRWSDAYLRTEDGTIETHDNGIALDPTHPGFKQLVNYYLSYFKAKGFDYLKLDFLTHGAMEGVHYDTNITTGIQAYNAGMRYVMEQNSNRMFLSESIAPIFPHQYANARRIYCDTSTSISDTKNTMQAVTYGWWLSGRCYQYNDPDNMKFSGASANENQSRLINCAISGTIFINGDDLTSAAGQNLAEMCLTHSAINAVARAGVSFRPVEGNTGTNAANVFVRQDGNTWYVAVFNYGATGTNEILNLARLGISGSYTAEDLWSGISTPVSGTTWTVNLGAKQAKLFRLGSGGTTASGPTNQAARLGATISFDTVAAGTPPFNYAWRKNGALLQNQTDNSYTVNSVELADAGTYQVQVTGADGSVTNSALLTLLNPTNIFAWISAGKINLSWPSGYTGWKLQMRTSGPGTNWSDVAGSSATNNWELPMASAGSAVYFRLIYQ